MLNEDEKALLGVLRRLNYPRYSLVLTLSLMVIAGFIGRFI